MFEPGLYAVHQKSGGPVRIARRPLNLEIWEMVDSGFKFKEAEILNRFYVIGGPITEKSLILSTLEGKWKVIAAKPALKGRKFDYLYKLPDGYILVHWTSEPDGYYWTTLKDGYCQMMSESCFSSFFQRDTPDPPVLPTLPPLKPGMRINLRKAEGQSGWFVIILVSQDDKGWMVCDETLRPYHITNQRLERKFVGVDETKKEKP